MDKTGPAFPFMPVATSSAPWAQGTLGLSKREWFAGLAMLGWRTDSIEWEAKDIAKWSVEDADALLAALAKEEGA